MDAKLREIIKQHLTYEIEMLFATQAKLQAGEPDRNVRNALIESFCIHARNLIDFLRGKRSGVRASSVTYDYTPFADGEIDREYRRMIEEQITHLGFGRTSNPVEQINGRVQATLLSSIAKELVRFKHHIREQYPCPWEIEIGDQIIFKKFAETE